MVKTFWHRINKKIESTNLEMGFNYYSNNPEDYNFLRKSNSSSGFLQLFFFDTKNNSELELSIKIINKGNI